VTQQLSGLETLAQVIRDNYPFAKVDTPVPLEAAHQNRHRKMVIRTSVGKFLVKTYQNNPVVLDALRFQHRLSDHLLKHGLPVAEIQRARNGQRIVAADTWALELQRFVDGEPMDVSKKTLAVSAEALGKMHEVCRDFPRPERDARMWRFSEVPRDSFAHVYQLAQKQGDPQRVAQDCNRIALFLHEASQALSFDARSQFETGLIHGDWHGGNLIFEQDRLAAIVDLEFSGDGCYLEDLSYAISNLCVRTTIMPERLAKRTDIVLDHYQKYRKLSFAEEIAMYYAIGVKHIATVSYQIQRNGQVAGHGPRDWMERLAAQSEWLTERAKRIRYG